MVGSVLKSDYALSTAARIHPPPRLHGQKQDSETTVKFMFSMFHLRISIPSYRQVFASPSSKQGLGDSKTTKAINSNKSHFVYVIEVVFLGEYGRHQLQYGLVADRSARFFRVEKRYSAFLALHNEVKIYSSFYN